MNLSTDGDFMAANDNSDFLRQQRNAVERMREMSARATANAPAHTMPPAPSFVRTPHAGAPAGANRTAENRPSAGNRPAEQSPEDANPGEHAPAHTSRSPAPSAPSGLGIPALSGMDFSILDRIKTEPDLPLILGLLLILWSENADRKLMIALMYILL